MEPEGAEVQVGDSTEFEGVGEEDPGSGYWYPELGVFDYYYLALLDVVEVFASFENDVRLFSTFVFPHHYNSY